MTNLLQFAILNQITPWSCKPNRVSISAGWYYLVSQGISWPALNQTVCALRFFYGVTLNRPEIPERIAHAREPRKLPVIFGADEVVRFLEAVPSLKTRSALTTAYAAVWSLFIVVSPISLAFRLSNGSDTH